VPVTTLFIDLDDTLYPASTGVWSLIRKRIDLYMHERLHLPWDEIPALRHELFLTYGTTLRGLQVTRRIDEVDFLAFVHDVPVEQMLSPHPALATLLHCYPQRKVILTNADRRHALRVLAALQITNTFDPIIDIQAISPFCKPQPEAFQRALELIGGPAPQDCLVVEDTVRNLDTARALGFQTILVSEQPVDPNGHPCIACLLELPTVFPPAPEAG
jgi:putative hydrolase of the HAD superfamily